MKRLFFSLSAVMSLSLAAFVGLWLMAPQVLVLAQEGFPPETLPEQGDFALVTGASDRAPASAVSNPLPKAAAARFAESGGRALIVDQAGAPRVRAFGNGAGPETLLNSFSLVKSLIGVLTLRAVADGKIDGQDSRLRDFLGDKAPDVSISELLTMTSGLSLKGEPPKDEKTQTVDDAAFSPFSPVARLHAFGPEAILQRLHVDPETRGTFHYQSVNTALLGMVLERVYAMPLEDLLSETIWRPAGASSAQWRKTPRTGKVSAYCCLYARADDWRLVGRFLMNNGTENAPLLPEAMWRAWILPDLSAEARSGGVYGAHVRHDVLDRDGENVQGPFAYMAGHGGQRVYLLPEEDAVIVRFGAEAQLLHSTLYELLGH